METTTERIRDRLAELVDPELGCTLGDLGMLKTVYAADGTVDIEIALTTSRCPMRARIRDAAIEAAAEAGGGDPTSVQVRFSEMTAAERSRAMTVALAERQRGAATPPSLDGTRVIAIASGKGGVGKSTLTREFGQRAARRGLRVGIADADILGFSQDQLNGVSGERLGASEGQEGYKIEPLRTSVGSGEVALVSVGLMMEQAGAALSWRGQMVARALQHFIEDVSWGKPDLLLIDLPPGTGDIPMALSRLLPRTRVVVVTTPSELAVTVAGRIISFAERASLEVLGVVENMSWYSCAHGGREHPFGSGGGRRLAGERGVALLGEIPLLAGAEEEWSRELDSATSALLEAVERSELAASSCTARLWEQVPERSRPPA